MSLLVSAPWIGVVAPAALALLLALLGRFGKPAVPWIALLGPLAVIGVGVACLGAIGGAASTGEPWTSALASAGAVEWFGMGGRALSLPWAVDSLAAIMLLVVGVVALMVMIFSMGYMSGDPGWVRYYALLSLFTAAMTLLVIGGSLLTLFVGWELVGASSFLLIGFWYGKPSASAAATKAFLTTRVGDVGLMVGLAVLWSATGSLAYADVMEALPSMAPAAVTAAAVLLAIGAIGKSAQFPLHIWLPDAMEGPTPVSALIHAATMVAAGVFLVARVWPLFEAAPAARTLLLVVGTVSALGAAVIAVAQSDIKKVLAYSTISQLGFMFAALGAGAWEVAFFHLVTHAAFKALLFLSAGSVIHGAGTQEMSEMGGLRKTMPITFVMWLIGVAALVGVWPLAGFFSKDAVLDAVWLQAPAAAIALFAATLLTAVYSAYATRLAFFGGSRGPRMAHESPLSMLLPLGVLALGALSLGLTGSALMVALGEHQEPLSLPISALAVTLAGAGAVLGWMRAGRVVVAQTSSADGNAIAPASRFMESARVGFGFDDLVHAVVIAPTVALSRGLWAIVDRMVVDGAVEGSAYLTRRAGARLSRAHAGDTQTYVALIILATALMLAGAAWLGR